MSNLTPTCYSNRTRRFREAAQLRVLLRPGKQFGRAILRGKLPARLWRWGKNPGYVDYQYNVMCTLCTISASIKIANIPEYSLQMFQNR